ncbi:MAG TPA: hypothetical protein VF230_16930 [Acidimicrobiales bacterium]
MRYDRRSRTIAGTCCGLLALLSFAGCDRGGEDTLSITFETEKPCLRAGEEQTIEARTGIGKAEIAYAPTYADGKFHGDTPRGFSDEDGVFRASWEIPDDVPPGRVTVRIIAAKGAKSDSANAPFHVATDEVPCP